MNKGKGLSLLAAILMFGAFSVIVFLLPLAHTSIFWLGYLFEGFATLSMGLTLMLYAGKRAKEDRFLALPGVKAAWTYFVLQTAASAWEIFGFPFAYTAALILNLGLGVVFTLLILILAAAAERIDTAEQQTTEKVLFIKKAKLNVDNIETEDPTLAKQLAELSESIRFSDPMSHSQLAEIEEALLQTIEKLAVAEETEKKISLCKDAQKLLKNRNTQCKMFKSVKDSAAIKESKGGGKLALAGIGAISILVLLSLTFTLIYVPAQQYKSAVELMSRQQFDDASALFEVLGNYKDSKDKLAQIANMQETESTVYFGIHDGKPIAWKILKTEQNKMLLIAAEPVKTLSFHNTLENITWESSDLRQWLNEKFLKEFSADQKKQILPRNGDDLFLLSKDEYLLYLDAAAYTGGTDWWLCTKTNAGMMFVDGEIGEIDTYGQGVVHALGVRPCVWVTLK